MAGELNFRAMNTEFLVAGLPLALAMAVRRQVELTETKLSRFLPASELSRINRAGRDWTPVSDLTLNALAAAAAAYHRTDGIFNPFLGRCLQRAGYDCSFEMLPQVGRVTDLASGAALADPPVIGWDCGEPPLEVDAAGKQVRLAEGLSLDLGGIAKGWTAQQAADGLIAAGAGCGLIDAGGDVVVWGQDPDQGSWGIGVAHPQGRETDIADLWLTGLTAIATSSVVKRRWIVGGLPAHHIIDPRTGLPAVSDFLQVTVLARDLTEAEQFAKCLLVLGSETGSAWLAGRRPDLAWIGVQRNGRILHGGALDHFAKEWEVRPHVALD